MTEIWPLRFRHLGDDLVFSNEAGNWFLADRQFLERYAKRALTAEDERFLRDHGNAYRDEGDLSHSSYMYKWSLRHSAKAPSIEYVILVPTLRCNLSCGYCQVSRASERASGYDWDAGTLAQVIQFLHRLTTESIQIEFQGGEPLLRLDLLHSIRDFCRARFKRSRFVVCSNFQSVNEDVWAFFNSTDTYLSTSIDGDETTHTRQRTRSLSTTRAFFANVRLFIDRFGADRISALPTIDPMAPPDLEGLLATYESFGVHSIYLRPINRQGFARRRPEAPTEVADWTRLHRQFIDLLVERNFASGTIVEEYYFSHLLKRVLRGGADAHVDIRNPNLVASNYLVIDYDGTMYPTDEARMMSRVGQINLSIGNVWRGLDEAKVDQLNASSFNDLDPDCEHCSYQPFCGTDLVDDISRYGRIDVPRLETYFCRRHLSLFDKAFEMITSLDPKVQYSLSKWLGVETWPRYFSEVHR